MMTMKDMIANPPGKTSHERNAAISDHIHDTIPGKVREIVNGLLDFNAKHCCQHNREILDEIIEDLQDYAKTLPSVKMLEDANVL